MKKLLLVGFIFIFLVNYASAYTNINIYIDEAGSALFLGETNEKINLPLGVEIKNEEIIGKTHKLTTKQGEIWSFFTLLKYCCLDTEGMVWIIDELKKLV